MLTTQGLLFAAYGLTFDESNGDRLTEFRLLVACAGLLIAAIVLLGVAALIRSKYISWKDYAGFFKTNPGLPGPLAERSLQWGVRTGNSWVTLLPDLLLPIVFVVIWSVVI